MGVIEPSPVRLLKSLRFIKRSRREIRFTNFQERSSSAELFTGIESRPKQSCRNSLPSCAMADGEVKDFHFVGGNPRNDECNQFNSLLSAEPNYFAALKLGVAFRTPLRSVRARALEHGN
jgi:hypothetical protein